MNGQDDWHDDPTDEYRWSPADLAELRASINQDATIHPHDRDAVLRAALRDEPRWFSKTVSEEVNERVERNPDGPAKLEGGWETATVYQLTEQARTQDEVTFPDDYRPVAEVKVLGGGCAGEQMEYVLELTTLAEIGRAGSGWVQALTDSRRSNEPGDIVKLPDGRFHMLDASVLGWSRVGDQRAITDDGRDLDR